MAAGLLRVSAVIKVRLDDLKEFSEGCWRRRQEKGGVGRKEEEY